MQKLRTSCMSISRRLNLPAFPAPWYNDLEDLTTDHEEEE